MELGEISKDFRPPADKPPKVKYFEPKPDGKDRFGNTLFRFLRMRDDIPEEAVAIVSPTGQEFITGNPTILEALENGISELRAARGTGVQRLALKGCEGVLEYLDTGMESDVYILDQHGKKKVIKAPRVKSGDTVDSSRTPANEMLMTQAITQDLAGHLRRHKSRLQTYVFATDRLACVEYEGGEVPTQEEVDSTIGKVIPKMRQYIDKQKKKKSPLWDETFLDIGVRATQLGGEYPSIMIGECRKSVDGIMTWIDPFVQGVDVLAEHGKLKKPPYRYEG